ncbi:MAG: LysM peptidoglycan-binding domain-containing protein, partial [Bacteroidaceae bacterium]|nr:LysM peptidoglycan-binding domain-containing protein [Bacteroidaceae bacterium]
IQSGETLYRLSRMYGITTQELCDANPGLSTSNFRVGETIRIPKVAENADINKPSKKEEETA